MLFRLVLRACFFDGHPSFRTGTASMRRDVDAIALRSFSANRPASSDRFRAIVTRLGHARIRILNVERRSTLAPRSIARGGKRFPLQCDERALAVFERHEDVIVMRGGSPMQTM
ncbi:hypothetical protein [Burkholderia mayonis]